MRLHIQEYFTQVANLLQPLTIDCQAAISVLGYGLVLARYQWRIVETGIQARGPIGPTVDALANGPVVYTVAPNDGVSENMLISCNSSYSRKMNRLIAPNWAGELVIGPANITIRPAGAAASATPLVWVDLVQVGTDSDPYALALGAGCEVDALDSYKRGKG